MGGILATGGRFAYVQMPRVPYGTEIKQDNEVVSLPFLQTDEAIPYFISSSLLWVGRTNKRDEISRI